MLRESVQRGPGGRAERTEEGKRVSDNGAVAKRPMGIYVALATPTTANGEVDHEGLGRLLEHVLAAGIDGISMLGSTGECASFSLRQRREIGESVLRQVRGRVPVIGGVN